jgi:RNA polymerase sigma-70 factor (ECF subfamily)
MDTGEDRALVARLASGDRTALEILYRRHSPWLTSRLQSRCGDPELVDLAVQDAFLAVWRSPKSYRGDGEVAAWLWGIAIRRLIDQLRRRRPKVFDPSTLDDSQFGAWPDAADEMLGSGVHGDVAAALPSLSPELRAVLIATAIDGLTTKEAAQLLGVPQGTVKTRLMRARQILQEALA